MKNFMKKNCKKQIKKYLGQKMQLKEKETSSMSNGKDMIVHSTAVSIKKMLNEILDDMITLVISL